MAIQLNSTTLSPQPNALTENTIQIQTDATSINGTMHRYWNNSKKQVEMTFSLLTTAEWTTLSGYVANQANTVIYNNTDTGYTFTGFGTITADGFIRGASFRRDVKVTIQEV